MLPDHLAVFLNFLGPAAASASCKLYYKATVSEPDENTDMNALADAFFALFDGPLADVLPTDCLFLNTRVLFKDSTKELEGFSTDNSAEGTVASVFMGEEVAVVLQRRTSKPGRSKRGRIFLPFVPVSYSSASTLTTTAITKYSAVGTAMEQDVVYDGVSYTPATPNFKDNVLENVTQVRLVGEIMSRRDRRFPKRPAIFN